MVLTLLREQNTAFPPALLFNHRPVGKPRSFLPTEGRIIPCFNPFSGANLPSDPASCPCPVFVLSFSQYSVLSTQHFFKRTPVS